MRHLLGLVTQTAVAAYVVSKSPWPDARLKAAMVLMFLCGFLKYSGRTYCLYSASPKSLRASYMGSVWSRQPGRNVYIKFGSRELRTALERFEVMFHAEKCREFINEQTLSSPSVDDIVLVDAPVDDWVITRASEELPDMLKGKNMPDRCIAYQYVAATLVQSCQWLYTKASLLKFYGDLFNKFSDDNDLLLWPMFFLLVPPYILFQCVSAVVALVLFVSAQKESRYSKADTTVSYILLVGAIVLDLLPPFMSIVSHARKPFRPGSVSGCVGISCVSCMQPAGWRTRKQWSEELAQYSMTRRYSTIRCVEDYSGCMPLIRKWILKCKPLLGDWCVEFLDLTHTPVTDDLKLFVLDRLLFFQTTREEWDFANFRGRRALGKWMDSHQVPVEGPERRLGYAALHQSLSSGVEFSMSVLIWHIATEICYFSEDSGHGTSENGEARTTTERKQRSRELSQYIMYLFFKCDVLLTTNSRLVHDKAHERLTAILLDQSATDYLDEKKAAIQMFDATKKSGRMINEEEATSATSSASATLTWQVLLSRDEALYPPPLPRAHAVALELIDITDEAERWHLISEVWLEMLFYTAPRCGPDFHYEHLSTGGEFISHVLLLMRSLGPFMPKPGA